MKPPDREACLERLAKDGYVVLERVIEAELVEALCQSLTRLEQELRAKPADNAFEGRATVRIYNLLTYGAPFTRVPVQPSVLPLVEGVIGEGALISSLSSIAIDPGETAQPLHADDQVIPLEKPHRPIVCNSMWALTDFTEANGATRLVPGTHLKPSPEYGRPFETIAAEMPKGSVLIWDGALWHGGGANRSRERRLGLAMNYCAGFIRQQENQQLGLSPDLVRTFDPKLRALIGYGVYRGLIGHIDKKSPDQLLTGEGEFRSIWDRARPSARSDGA
ncbi:MAG TPA: phytanoyl-CoA dioxygenase family protein [Caulobacteraceae bacterium]|nr:phytanoyl-CoA dioxygenase family protein [Caulobacteraceae bacterium]